MPTTRPRHLITESDQMSVALDAAAHRWPEDADSRAQLLVRLALEGYRAVQEAEEAQRTAWQAAVASTAGALAGVWPPGDIERLHQEWPE